MFKCQKCEESTSKTNFKVVETREKNYKNYIVSRLATRTILTLSQEQVDRDGFQKEYKVLHIKTSSGKEIAKEVKLCNKCYDEKSNKEGGKLDAKSK